MSKKYFYGSAYNAWLLFKSPLQGLFLLRLIFQKRDMSAQHGIPVYQIIKYWPADFKGHSIQLWFNWADTALIAHINRFSQFIKTCHTSTCADCDNVAPYKCINSHAPRHVLHSITIVVTYSILFIVILTKDKRAF